MIGQYPGVDCRTRMHARNRARAALHSSSMQVAILELDLFVVPFMRPSSRSDRGMASRVHQCRSKVICPSPIHVVQRHVQKTWPCHSILLLPEICKHFLHNSQVTPYMYALNSDHHMLSKPQQCPSHRAVRSSPSHAAQHLITSCASVGGSFREFLLRRRQRSRGCWVQDTGGINQGRGRIEL
jgi:hypothetical protein